MSLAERIINEIGTNISDKVWYDPELKPVDIKLYKILLDYNFKVYNMDKGKRTYDENLPIITVSQLTLSKKVGTSDKTLRKSLDRLIGVGLIREDCYRGFRRNNFIIIIGDYYGIYGECEEGTKRKELNETIKNEEGVEDMSEVVRKPIVIPKIEGLTPEEQKNAVEETVKLFNKKLKENSSKETKVEVTKTSKEEPPKKSNTVDIETLREKHLKNGGLTYTEKQIVELSKHYNMLAREFLVQPSYNSLKAKNPKDSKNWKYFEKVHYLCKENEWNSKLYLEAQFDRAETFWKNCKIKYPLPKMLCSEKAQNYYVWFIEDRKERFSKDVGHVNLGARKTNSMQDTIFSEIFHSVDTLLSHMSENTKEEKAVTLFNYYPELSPYYLYSVPWLKEIIKQEADLKKAVGEELSKGLDNTIKHFKMLDQNKSLQEVVFFASKKLEENNGIPENMTIDEISFEDEDEN